MTRYDWIVLVQVITVIFSIIPVGFKLRRNNMAGFNTAVWIDNESKDDVNHIICTCPICQRTADIQYKGFLRFGVSCKDCGCPVTVRNADEQLSNTNHT